jgi:hypothetical protein
MGNSQSDAIGKKIRDGFDVVGKKMGEGWGEVTNFGNKVWNGVKSVPVLGQIAEGVEKYTPIGLAATNILRTANAGITGASKVLQGDLKGAIQTGIDYGRDVINKGTPLSNIAKKIPGVGGLVSGMQSGVMNTVGNAALNSIERFKEGDVKGGLTQGLKAGTNLASGRFGKAKLLNKVVNRIV